MKSLRGPQLWLSFLRAKNNVVNFPKKSFACNPSSLLYLQNFPIYLWTSAKFIDLFFDQENSWTPQYQKIWSKIYILEYLLHANMGSNPLRITVLQYSALCSKTSLILLDANQSYIQHICTKSGKLSTAQFLRLPIFPPALVLQNSLLPLESHVKSM